MHTLLPRTPTPAAAVALAVVLGLGAAGCTGGGGSDGVPPHPEPSSTALGDADLGGATVVRNDFCSLIEEESVQTALGGTAAGSSQWADGERVRISRGRSDVAHEYGCSYRGRDGTVAKVWVFAPPVTRQDARRLAREARGQAGCTTPDTPSFGDPGAATVCRSEQGAVATYAGLFVDAWLTCSLRDPDRDATGRRLVDRAGRWCVAAVTAARTDA